MSVELGNTVSLNRTKIHKNSLKSRILKHKYLYILILPGIIWALVFCYAPIYGLYMAFINYIPESNFFQSFIRSEFVGLDWFKFFFQTGDFLRILRNTLATSVLTLVISFPAPIILALVLNECRALIFKRMVQTVSYLPHFISWVITANIFLTMMSSGGVINQLLMSMGLTKEPIMFFQDGKLFWLLLAIANTWKGMGYSSIIYLAAITSINDELYAAASIDGANRWQRMIYITLPSIMPTAAVMLVLSVGGLLNAGFEQQLLMGNPTILEYSDVIDTYSYRYGFGSGMHSYGAAVGLFKSLVNFILLMVTNFIVTKIRGRTLL